jgi:hypothetical protein
MTAQRNLMRSSASKKKRSVKLTPKLRAFCDRLGIASYVAAVTEIVGDCFEVVGPITLRPECDPETGEEWLVVDVNVRGSVAGVMEQYHRYTDRKLAALPVAKADRIRLSHHIAEHEPA